VTFTYDPLQHQTLALSDGLGRLDRNAVSTGNSPSTWAWYTEVDSTYDANGQLVKLLHQNFTSATTYTYDSAGRKTGMSDPDRGTETYSYDADGNRITSVDARGGAGTVYAGYDGIDRQLWRNSSNTPSGANVTYNYDSTAGGNYGIGHLTGETFTGGPNHTLSGSYSYVYDRRGQQISNTETVGSASYPVSTTYDDSGNTLTQTYPDGEVVTNGYTAQGWLGQVSTTQGGTTTTLLANADYSGSGGAGHLMTGASLGNNTYHYSATYDALLRLANVQLTRQSDGATLFAENRTFDAAGNLTTLATTLSQGTDTQAFCYDDLNRLVWAGSTGTPSCGGTLSAGTLTSAAYTATYSYDTLNRLTSGPLGSYSYGDSAHLDAATQAGMGSGQYTASYDASGDMRCRAPSGSTTCTGSSPTGAQMTYDAERRMTSWQNTPTAPTSQAWYLYDGEGHRVEQYTSGGSGGNGHTYYLPGNVEEVTPSGSLVKYYSAGGLTLGENTASDASGIAYLASDGLGSVTEALNQTGTATGSLLYGPDGGVRYSNGAMPTSKGFTGQYSDASTGLDYYGARYYDPTLGQFTSADTVSDGLNRYGYVKGNPETATDPTGHSEDDHPDPWGGEGGLTTGGTGGGGDGGDGDGGGSGEPEYPEDYINRIYGAWSRFLGMAPGAAIGTVITLGRGDSVQIILEQSTLMVTYNYGDHTSATFNATYAPYWLRGQWLQVLSEHAAGDPYDSTVRRPGRVAYAPLTSKDRAANFAYIFGDTPPAPARGAGWTTNVPAGGRGDVQIRCMDYSNSRYGRGQGPYLRFQVGTDPSGGPTLNFNGQTDDNPYHNHYYLGTGGEGDDLPLQNALAGTILYQYEFGP
jgi:RHS repeat-associated protein